ncbi:ABC transporter permease [Paenibacillus sp. NPDC058071]|uniref:ABC transporter permease n=1 Tax=Paenibacillus sp. NPDC058071 TaxID=3346326 RepID=UPI0036DC45BC
MINSMQRAIIKKDIRGITANKQLFTTILIVPLVLTVILPSIFILVIYFVPEGTSDFQKLLEMLPVAEQTGPLNQNIIKLVMNSIMPVFFLIIPIMASSVMAASSFVGEKEKSTLETLLYCPLSLRQIFQSKILASFLMSMIVSFTSFLAMMLVMEIEIVLTTGSMILPSISWLIIMLLVSPAISLIAITLIVRGSAKAQTVEEAQQRTVFLVLPVILLVVGQFTGILLVSIWILLGLGVVLSLLAVILIRGSMGKFSYETILG